MIFEDRAANAPSTAIGNFRDELEEATAAARAARGTGTASQAVATQPATTGPGQPTTTGTEPQPADPQPQPFETVEDNPATTEPLPPVQSAATHGTAGRGGLRYPSHSSYVPDRQSPRLNSSHSCANRMPSS